MGGVGSGSARAQRTALKQTSNYTAQGYRDQGNRTTFHRHNAKMYPCCCSLLKSGSMIPFDTCQCLFNFRTQCFLYRRPWWAFCSAKLTLRNPLVHV